MRTTSELTEVEALPCKRHPHDEVRPLPVVWMKHGKWEEMWDCCCDHSECAVYARSEAAVIKIWNELNGQAP